MFRQIMTATAVTLMALPAAAQTATPAGSGALAGRSPVQAYRTDTAAQPCKAAMHSLPAGKLPTYGTHALPSASRCAANELASAETPKRDARD